MNPLPTCVFCQIASGKLPAQIVYEDSHSLAFLDTKPLFPGHVLLIPRLHYATLPDLPEEALPDFFRVLQHLARVVPVVMKAEGSFVANNNHVSQSVPHLHYHVVPRRKKDGLKGFFWPRQTYRDDAHLQEVGDRLRAALNASK